MKKIFLKTGTFVLTALISFACLVGCRKDKTTVAPEKTIENITASSVTVLVGKAVELQIQNLQTGDKILYSKDNKAFVESPLAFSEKGTYALYYKIVRTGYKSFVSSVQVEVVGADSLFTIDGDTLTIGTYAGGLLTTNNAVGERITATPYESILVDGVQINADSEYTFAVESVAWTIVERTDNGYLAVSNQIIDAMPYHTEYASVAFDNASIKTQISAIYNKMFSGLEKEICTVDVLDANLVASLGAKGTELLQATASDYAIARGCWVSDLAGYVGNGAYWLKNSATDARYAQFVDFNGKVNADGYMVHAPYYGIRLVLTITL